MASVIESAYPGNSYLEDSKRVPKEQAEFLLRDGNMEGRYLGACLDSCRWGGKTTVMYEMSLYDMISFIQNWMQQNEDGFCNRFNEKEVCDLYAGLELPYINHDACPRDKGHKGRIRDFDGKLRCAHTSKKGYKPGFVYHFNLFDEHSQAEVRDYYDSKPTDPLPDDAWDDDTGDVKPEFKEEYQAYLELLETFKQEEPTFIVTERCGAIISEKDYALPLETILKRLCVGPVLETVYCGRYPEPCRRQDELDEHGRDMYELTESCPGHVQPAQQLVFSMDGRTLASYIQKWYEQIPDGQAPILEEESM